MMDASTVQSLLPMISIGIAFIILFYILTLHYFKHFRCERRYKFSPKSPTATATTPKHDQTHNHRKQISIITTMMNQVENI